MGAFFSLFIVLVSGSALANDWWSTISDSALRQCLMELAQKNAWHHASDVKEISCHSRSIRSLDGLPPFTQLESLSLHNNQLTDVVMRDQPQLKRLVVSRNRLKSLHIQNTPHLTELFFFDNVLAQLQLNDLPKLTLLKGNANQLQQFNYTNLPALEKIYLFNNKLVDIDIHHLPALRYMDVRQNPMPDELYQRMDKMNNITFLHDGNALDWKP